MGWRAAAHDGACWLMLGHSHALSGAVTGLAAGTLLHMSTAHTVALAGFTAGMALLPDLDKCGSGPARSLGFLSEGIAWVVEKISGGHRHATHSVLGIAVFTALAWVSAHFSADWAGKAGLALLMMLSVAGGLDALRISRKHAADVVGIVVAAAAIWYDYGLTLIPLAVLIGCCTHILGDLLTDQGCMLFYPVSRHRFHLLPEPLAFTTGTKPELVIVDPVLTVVLIALAGHVADPGLLSPHHHLAGR